MISPARPTAGGTEAEAPKPTSVRLKIALSLLLGLLGGKQLPATDGPAPVSRPVVVVAPPEPKPKAALAAKPPAWEDHHGQWTKEPITFPDPAPLPPTSAVVKRPLAVRLAELKAMGDADRARYAREAKAEYGK